MRDIDFKEVVEKVGERASFDLSNRDSRLICKGLLSNFFRIIKNSKGKIRTNYCDLKEAYKDIPLEEMKWNLMNLNEIKRVQDRVRIY